MQGKTRVEGLPAAHACCGAYCDSAVCSATQAEGLRQQLDVRGAALEQAGRDMERLRTLLGEAQDAAGDARARADAAEAALRAQAAEASALRFQVRLRHAALRAADDACVGQVGQEESQDRTGRSRQPGSSASGHLTSARAC
jgi:hypothetical protein